MSGGEGSLPARLHRGITAAAAAAGRPVWLLKLGLEDLGHPPVGEAPDLAVEAVVAINGTSLEAVHVYVNARDGRHEDADEGDEGGEVAAQAAAAARVAALAARLPALRNLSNELMGFRHPLALDFRAVHARLSRLVLNDSSFRERALPGVRLSPTTAASLRALALQSGDGDVARPPACLLRAAGALTALTRLEYGVNYSEVMPPAALDLAAWGATAEYCLPALRVLTVWSATGFTVDGQGGRVGPNGQEWVAVLLATLPRLESLTLAVESYVNRGVFASDKPPVFVCRRLFFGPGPCEDCRQTATCAEAAATRSLIMHGLPAAAVAAGRRLAVVLGEDGLRPEWLHDGDFDAGLPYLTYGPAPR